MTTTLKPIWNSGEVDEVTSQKNYATAYDLLRKSLTSLPSIYKAAVTVDAQKPMSFPIVVEKSGIYILDVHLKANANLNFTYVNRAPIDESSMTIVRFHLEKGAILQSSAGIFGGANSSLFLETALNGEDSQINERTVFWADGEQVFDVFSTTTHIAKNTSAFIESKGIAHEKSAVRFDGKIHITQPAQGSHAKLDEHTLLLSPGARMNAVPGLRIDTNDVVATHSASMTRVDDEQMFYCESRGIPAREGMKLIAEGFLKSAELPETFLREIEPLIEQKLNNL